MGVGKSLSIWETKVRRLKSDIAHRQPVGTKPSILILLLAMGLVIKLSYIVTYNKILDFSNYLNLTFNQFS